MRMSRPTARVLVVEDDIVASEIAAAYLRQGGLHAVEARNAAQPWHALPNSRSTSPWSM
jgi:CheY-like chemotaxis protein